jgi:hypothetical protein
VSPSRAALDATGPAPTAHNFRIQLEKRNDRLRRELPVTRSIKQDMDFSLFTDMMPVPAITMAVYGLSNSDTAILPDAAACIYYYKDKTVRFEPIVEADQTNFKIPRADSDVEIAILLAFKTPVKQVKVNILDEFNRSYLCSWLLDI